ncbi:baseplate J/gp47 family protein [Vibrio scophthalmi]|uniref:baseplate J/gp47 family protein n=1 Tax=Vibrio scophthalmi TaxID=45658 RepID=UPI003AACD8EB
MSNKPSLQQLIDRAKSTMIAQTRQNNPAINAIACAIAGVSYGQYGYQDYLFRELHPETCSEAWLYLHANRHGEPRLLPTFARGFVEFEQLGGVVVIKKGALLTWANQEYETVKEQYSNVPVEVVALESGAASNLTEGNVLSLSEGLNGVNPSNVKSLGIEGGADIEALEHWRVRVVAAYQKNERVGKAEDYQAWAISAHADVDYAWVQDNTPERGMVEVFIGTRQNNPAVSQEVVNLVQQNFEDNRLAGCHPFAKVPEQAPLNIEIQGIEDQPIRDDVIIALQNLVKSKMGKVKKVDNDTRLPESITNTEIVMTISAITTNFIVRHPVGEVVIGKNQIHVLGAITWTPPT